MKKPCVINDLKQEKKRIYKLCKYGYILEKGDAIVTAIIFLALRTESGITSCVPPKFSLNKK